MANKQISTILKLKDNMSPKLVKVSASLRDSATEAKNMAKSFGRLQSAEAIAARQTRDDLQKQVKEATAAADKINKSVSGMVKKCTAAVKIGVSAIAAAGALAIKTGLTEAFDLETYRSQLETATKDTKKAGQVMAAAIDLANRTPFESGELVAAAASLETYGLSSERWLSVYGDTAAALNKDISDVQRGITKALSTGSFATIDDATGINKKAFEDYSKQKFGKSFLNKSGQVTDVELMQDAIEGLLKERYGGSMEKLSQTFKGSLSTITGAAKNAAAQIVGITSEGEIATGSLVDYIRTKTKELADTISQWEASGKLDEIREEVSSVAQTIVNLIDTAYKLKPLIGVVAGVATGISILNAAMGAHKKIKEFAEMVNPFFTGALSVGKKSLKGVGGNVKKFGEILVNGAGHVKNFAVSVVTKGIPAIGNFIKNLALSIVGLVKQGVAFVAQKAVMLGSAIATKAAAAAQWLFNTSLLGCPIVWIIVGIAALVAGIILLVKNWDKVVAVIKRFGDFCKKVFMAYFNWWKKWILDPVVNFFKKIFEFWEKVKGWFSKIFGKKTEFEYTENHTFADETDGTDYEETPDTAKSNKIVKPDENATGTNYFKGGWTKINERGPELVKLPSGTKIMNADKTRGLVNKKEPSNGSVLMNVASGFIGAINALKKDSSNVMPIKTIISEFSASVSVFKEAANTFSRNPGNDPVPVLAGASGHTEPVYSQTMPIRRYNITNQFYIQGENKKPKEIAEEVAKILMEEMDNT